MNLIFAKKGKSDKIKNHYLSLFKDEVQRMVVDSSMGIANLFSDSQEFVGKGLFLNGASKVFRLLTYQDEAIDEAFLRRRIAKALAIRDFHGFSSAFRLIHAEGDLLPGIVADYYQGTLIVQIRHPVWEGYRSMWVDAFCAVLGDRLRGIYERSDFESTPEVGLKRYVGPLWGNPQDKLTLTENGLQFEAQLVKGQKTGFFLDQRDSRRFLDAYLKNMVGQKKHAQKKRGLDLFCYTGSFALHMASHQMSVVGVDKSPEAVHAAQKNAVLDGLENDTHFVCDDAFSWLKKDMQRYAVIILDPPSLVKDQREVFSIKRKLISLVSMAMEKLENMGLIGLCSCSYHLGWDVLGEVLRKSAYEQGRRCRVIGQTIQSADHPWMLQMPETLYLRCFWVEVDQV